MRNAAGDRVKCPTHVSEPLKVQHYLNGWGASSSIMLLSKDKEAEPSHFKAVNTSRTTGLYFAWYFNANSTQIVSLYVQRQAYGSVPLEPAKTVPRPHFSRVESGFFQGTIC